MSQSDEIHSIIAEFVKDEMRKPVQPHPAGFSRPQWKPQRFSHDRTDDAGGFVNQMSRRRRVAHPIPQGGFLQIAVKQRMFF